MLAVALPQIVEGHGTKAWVVHVGGYRGGAIGGSDGACHEAAPPRLRGHHRIGGGSSAAGGGGVHRIGVVLQAIIRKRNTGGIERVGFDHVGASLQIGRMDVANDGWLGHGQQVIAAAQVVPVLREKAAAKIAFF